MQTHPQTTIQSLAGKLPDLRVKRIITLGHVKVFFLFQWPGENDQAKFIGNRK